MQYSSDYEDYEEKYLKILKNIVCNVFNTKGCIILFFGSRARGRYRRDSDYDIGVMNIEHSDFVMKKNKVEEIIEESIIPHRVDIINLDEVDNEFKERVIKEGIIWKS